MRWQIAYLLRDFVVAPHTFLKPKARPVAAPLELGAQVPALSAIRTGRPAIVAFLRHVGCPFAEATVRQLAGLDMGRVPPLRGLAAAHPGIDFIAVPHSRDQPSRSWCDVFGGAAGVTIVAD